MSFTETLWSDTADLQAKILAMPFNTDLAEGTLARDIFQRYIIQDAHYLEGFARALSLAAARAPDPAIVAQLSGSAHGALVVEAQLHETYMGHYGISAEAFRGTPISRACDHYVSFLIRSAAVDPFPVTVAALLPCFWIYHEVGQSIHATAAPDHPYRDWVDTYAGDAFTEAVEKMKALTDQLASGTDEDTRARMRAAFARSTWHEWMFWHSAYVAEAWPAPE